MIEELREAGIDLGEVTVHHVNLMKGEQFSDEFTRVSPNQKIPALDDDGILLFESCAILHYLAEKHPTPLLPPDEKKWQVLTWLYWQAANLGPVFGNKLSYTRYMDSVAGEQKAHPLERFGTEAKRLLSVFDKQLGDQPFLCGNDLTVADISVYPWMRAWKWAKVDITDKPRVMAWLERVKARPGVGRGVAYGVPEGEVDRWSKQRRAQYASSGSTIASNDNIKGSIR